MINVNVLGIMSLHWISNDPTLLTWGIFGPSLIRFTYSFSFIFLDLTISTLNLQNEQFIIQNRSNSNGILCSTSCIYICSYWRVWRSKGRCSFWNLPYKLGLGSIYMFENCISRLMGEIFLPEHYIWVPNKGQNMGRFWEGKSLIPHLVVLVKFDWEAFFASLHTTKIDFIPIWNMSKIVKPCEIVRFLSLWAERNMFWVTWLVEANARFTQFLMTKHSEPDSHSEYKSTIDFPVLCYKKRPCL